MVGRRLSGHGPEDGRLVQVEAGLHLVPDEVVGGVEIDE